MRGLQLFLSLLLVLVLVVVGVGAYQGAHAPVPAQAPVPVYVPPADLTVPDGGYEGCTPQPDCRFPGYRVP